MSPIAITGRPALDDGAQPKAAAWETSRPTLDFARQLAQATKTAPASDQQLGHATTSAPAPTFPKQIAQAPTTNAQIPAADLTAQAAAPSATNLQAPASATSHPQAANLLAPAFAPSELLGEVAAPVPNQLGQAPTAVLNQLGQTLAVPPELAVLPQLARPPATEPTFELPVQQAPDSSKPALLGKPAAKKLAVSTDPVAAVQAPVAGAIDPSILQILTSFITTLTGAVPAAASATPDAAPTVLIGSAIAQPDAPTVADAAGAAKPVIVQPLVALPAAPEPPLTPLEQSVHQMLSELSDHKDEAKPDFAMAQAIQLAPTTMIAAPATTVEVRPTAPLAPQQPQELVSQNHAHLVFDDPSGRIVMTVAIRGSEVNVSVRASNDATAAALARNAGTLEDAMRGRGLQLAHFSAQRDLTREQREKPMYERPRDKTTVKKSDGERFTLEENS